MPSKIANKCKNTDLTGLSECLNKENVDTADIWGQRPLYHAVRYKNLPCIRFLFKMGADVFLLNRVCGHEEDLLVTAFRSQDILVIKEIISFYLTHLSHYQHIRSHMTMYLPYIFRGNTEYLKIFFSEFKIFNLKGHESVFCKTAKKAHYVLLSRMNICFDLQNALKYTVIYRRSICFLYLLSIVRYPERLNHVYRGTTNCVQQTLMSLCGVNGYYKGIQHLIDAGADTHIPSVNERGETRNNLMALVDNPCYNLEKPLRKAAIQKCLRLYATIYGINEQNSRGQSALMFAERAGNYDLVKILLELGANSSLIDMNGSSSQVYTKPTLK